MAELTKRVLDCQDDCEKGERGERGKRGRRGEKGERGERGERGEHGEKGHDGCDGKDGKDGRDGHTGPTGPTGPSGFGFTGPTGSMGPTGPTATGPTGPAGSGEGVGLEAYGYAVNIGSQVVEPGQPVAFDLGGRAFPNRGITPPLAGQMFFTVLSDGDYEFDFHVLGQHVNAEDGGMDFAIYVNGVSLGPAYTFHSNEGSDGNDVQLVTGSGIIGLRAGDVVTLVNESPFEVQLTSFNPPSNNATLSLKKLGPLTVAP